jgi:hypothetical protein
MIDHGRLKGAIGGMQEVRTRLLQIGPRSHKSAEVAKIVTETEDLIAKLESLRANTNGRESE